MNAEEDDGAYVENWNELKVPELREELEARGLDPSGNKQALVARLEEADAKAEEAEAEEPDSETEAEAEAPEIDATPTEPVEPPEPPAETATAASEPLVPSGAVFHAEFDVPDDYDSDDEDWDLSWKLQARDAAIAAGHEVYPAAYSASFLMFGSRDGKRTVVYQVPTVRQFGPQSSYESA